MKSNFPFIDLFAGCGGLSEGFYKQKFIPLAHVEHDYYSCESLRKRMSYYGFNDLKNAVIQKDIKDKNKTLNVLDNKFKFNFKINDLKKFKKFKKIAIIGMGGSILGAEAIHNFLQHKIKKEIYFLNDLNDKKIKAFKKKKFIKNSFYYNFKIRKYSRNFI